MRTQGFRFFAIVSTLALLFGAQVCMVVQCAPGKSTSLAHQCCVKAAAANAADSPLRHPAPQSPAPHESTRPCCVQVTTAAAPELHPPAATGFQALAAVLVTAQLAVAPATAPAPPRPGDVLAPGCAPPLSAAGSRAPPRA
ncbi:MAG: hypothetical protein IT347_12715 [Candidatus Eisenbacteria bacterium]|nr:hypothetical protein [Candidatus Eisenbacteria bacterium]